MGFSIEQDFLDTLALYFGAGVYLVDYAHDTEGARKLINDWVAYQTEQRIQDLIPKGALSTMTRLVLTNAIYFNAAWRLPFQKGSVRPTEFTHLDGSKVTVDMMHETTDLRHARLADLDAVELPYDGNEVSMIIILPDQGQFETVEANLADEIPRILQSLQLKLVALSLPKFQFTTDLSLQTALEDMGIYDVFSSSADLSGINPTEPISVSRVIHKAFVAVDEAGTEAAAATAVVLDAGLAEPTPPDATVTVDRPFLFVIRDIQTGAFLFMGSVRDPSAQN